MNIFSKEIPDGSVISRDANNIFMELIRSDKLSEKFYKLNVSLELQVSILADLFDLSGSGSYLYDTKSTERNISMSLLYQAKVKEEAINIQNENLKECLAIEALKSAEATHVVVGISWGANIAIRAEYKTLEKENKYEADIALSGVFSKCKKAFDAGKTSAFTPADEDVIKNLDIKIYGDILPGDGKLPGSIEAAIELAEKVPSLIATCNNGKGVPLFYTLLPLEKLHDYFEIPFTIDSIHVNVRHDTLGRIVKLFEDIAMTKQLLQQFFDDVYQHRYCLLQKYIDEVNEKHRYMSIYEADIRSNLAIVLPAVRKGECDVSSLEYIIKQHEESNYSVSSIRLTISSWDHIRQIINFVKSLERIGACYVGKGRSFDEIVAENYGGNAICVMYVKISELNELECLAENRQLFMGCCTSNEQKCFIVDCDVHSQLWPGKVCVRLVQDAEVIEEDLVQQRLRYANLNMARSRVKMTRVQRSPNKRGTLKTRCTGKNCNPERVYKWQCEKCKSTIEYGFDDNFSCYCKCGMACALYYEFKCSDPLHGIKFQKPNAQFLIGQLDLLRPFPEHNILILGETGVGKSTWINAFYNYVLFDEFEEARKCGCVTLIPSSFFITDSSEEEVFVSTGGGENECQKTGQSATQSPRVYCFSFGDTMFRLIDTPGVGDVRGLEQDKVNLEQILQVVSAYDEIHGICILLKPDSTRLNASFTFCIMELLKYLHKDACNNIAFCFTHARGTNFRGGTTVSLLKTLLADKHIDIPLAKPTVYYFDSVSYLVLAATSNKHPVSVHEDDIEDARVCWHKSCNEAVRLLRHLGSLAPHQVKGTLSLNNARRAIEKLVEPLAQLSRNILTKVQLIEQEKSFLENNICEIEDLERIKMTKRPKVEITKLQNPRTVCGHNNCTQLIDGSIVYSKICHDNCWLRFVGTPCNSVGHFSLNFCHVFTRFQIPGYDCFVCGHPCKDHLHIYYESKVVQVDVEDPSIVEALKPKLDLQETKELVLKNKEIELLQLKDEMTTLQRSSAKFACFLQQCAIVPYNDALLPHLELLIEEERKKRIEGHSTSVVEGLYAMKDRYNKEKALFDQEYSLTGSMVIMMTPREVEAEIDKLSKLPHVGPTIQEARVRFCKIPHNVVETGVNMQVNGKQERVAKLFKTLLGSL